MVKDGEASRMATAPSQSLGSSMMMSGTAGSIMNVSGVSMVMTRSVGGTGVGGDEAGSLVNLTMSRASSRERARRRADALGATGGVRLGESGSMSVVLGGGSTTGNYNRLGVESGKPSPAVTRATTAEVNLAAEKEDGRGQEQNSGMSRDPISPIVPFRRGDICEEQGLDDVAGTRIGSGGGDGDGDVSGQFLAEGGDDGSGGSGLGEAAQVMRISTAKSIGGGLVRGSSSRTLQYVMAGSSAASSRLSTATGGVTHADPRAVGGSGAHASSVCVRMDFGGVDGDGDDAYPEEGVDEIRYAAEARMRDRLVVIEESKRDGGLLFEAGR